MSVEAGQIVRAALATWLGALGLTDAPDVEGGPPDAGERPGLPVVSLAWGPVQGVGERATVSEMLAGDLRAVWLLGHDEAQARFMLRAADPDEADRLANELRGKFALAAAASNTGGDPVLHFDVTLGESVRTGKVYLDGTFSPPEPADVATRSLYTQSIGALVVYPRFHVESVAEATGLMIVSLTIDGVTYDLTDFEEA